MMIAKNIFTLLCILLLCPVFTSAQFRRQQFATSDRQIDLLKLANDNVMFLFPDFHDAVVCYPAGRQMEFLVNYNMLQDAIYVVNEQNTTSILSTTLRFDSIVIPSKNMVFTWHRIHGFMERASPDNALQIRHRTTHSVKEFKMQPYTSIPTLTNVERPQSRILDEREFIIQPNYISLPNPSAGVVEVNLIYRPILVFMKDNTPVEITSRRDLNRLFPQHTSVIRDFLRRERISFDVHEHLVKLAGFLHQLHES